jgi:hypothetical protein
MPRANPDYAGITKAAQAIARAEVQDLDADPKAADTLSGRTDIVWHHSDTTARTVHVPEAPTAPAKVAHQAYFKAEAKALPPVQLEYGTVTFWPEEVCVTWMDGHLASIFVGGHQVKKSGDGIGKDLRKRTFRTRVSGGYDRGVLDWDKVPVVLRGVIARYELKVPVASPSPVVVA